MTLLALATLGDATKNRNDPLCVALPKVAKARRKAILHHNITDIFDNKYHQCTLPYIQPIDI
jgi:hypothetical protein